jgi:hypothetical protein
VCSAQVEIASSLFEAVPAVSRFIAITSLTNFSLNCLTSFPVKTMTRPMCRNLLLFAEAQSQLGEPLVCAISLAFARIFVQGQEHFAGMLIGADLLGKPWQPPLAEEIALTTGKSRAKGARLAIVFR